MLGAPRPQTRGKGFQALYPIRRWALFRFAYSARLLREGCVHRGFWPQEPKKNRRGKLAFLSDLFYGFPRIQCIQAGVLWTPGQKLTPSLPFHMLPPTAEQCCFSQINPIPQSEVQEMKSPGAGV